jgi:hypothetical protein
MCQKLNTFGNSELRKKKHRHSIHFVFGKKGLHNPHKRYKSRYDGRAPTKEVATLSVNLYVAP